MARNKISDLRNHLFATLESLTDEENPMDVNRAKAVASVAQSIINSVKVEIDYQKLVDKQNGCVVESNLTKFLES